MIVSEEIYHSIDAGHIRNIGEQSVSNKIQAILELVKNAYDADSPDCIVTFHGSRNDENQISIQSITIEDHGIGMTKDDIKNKFMKVGTGNKIDESFSPKLGRRMSGEKGMGHYSVQRLGDQINIITTPEPFKNRKISKEDNSTTYNLVLNWNEYVSGKSFERIANKLYKQERKSTGTSICISKLRDSWTFEGKNNDLEMLSKNLGNIMLPKELQSGTKEKFEACLETKGFEINLPKTKGTLLDYAPYKIQGYLRGKHVKFTIFRHKKNKMEMHPIKDGTISAEDAECGNADITLYWFPGVRSEWTKGAMKPRLLHDQLEEKHGIKIYNDKIRVMPYGEAGNDWMGLGTRKSRPASGGMARNDHFVGFLKLSKKNNPEIIETTTRQAVRENDAFESLKNDFVMPIIEELENKKREIDKQEEEMKRKTQPANIARLEIERVIEKINESKNIGKTDKQDINIRLTKVSNQIVLEKQLHDENEEKLITNLEMYRNLSTVGIQTLAFNHEIINPIRWIKGTLTNLINLNGKLSNEEKLKDMEKCHAKIISSLNWANQIKEFSSLLSGSDVSKKKRTSIKIDDCLREIRDGMGLILDALKVTIHDPVVVGDIPDVVMNKASFESIFINLISNSIRSLKRVNRDRNINLKISKTPQVIKFEFTDNGYGISEENEEKIFRPFFTTYKNPDDKGTGMGLTIIKEIVEDDYDGKVILEKSISEKKYPGKGMARFSIQLPLDKVTFK